MNLTIKNKGDLSDKVLSVAEKFLSENRRYFGIAAAGLQNQLDDPKYEPFNINRKMVGKGIEGEKKTSLILREWIQDKPECVLVDSISLPINKFEPENDGDEGQLDLGDTDHLLIIGNTLIIIDSKNWRKSTYKVDPDVGVTRGTGNESFYGSKPRINEMKYLWENYYKDVGIDNINAFVAISDPEITIVRDRNWWRVGYKLVNQTTLTYFLDKWYQGIEPIDYIRVELVAKALTGLIRPYNKFKEKYGFTYNIATGKKK